MSGTKSLVGAALLLQGVLLSCTFPIGQLLTDTPLLHNDAGYHWYQISLGKDLAGAGTLVGYDANFNAGYPGGVTYNWSAKGPTAVAIMVSFVACSFAALPYAAAALRYLEGRGDWRHLAALGAAGALLVLLHFMFPIPVAVLMAAAVLAGFRPKSPGRATAVFIVLPVLGLVPNLTWLLPARHYWSVFAAGVPDPFPHQKVVDPSVLWKELAGVWGATAHGAKTYFPIALSAAVACFAPFRAEDRRSARAWTIAGIALAVFAAVGAALPPLAQVQPNRFGPVAYLFLCVPAAIGLEALLRRALSGATTRRVMASALLVLALPGLLYAGLETVREVTPGPGSRYGVAPPEVKGVGEKSRWALDWLRSGTDTSGRVLFETSRGLVYDGDHMAGYLSRESGREFIGGPYPYHHFAGFWDGMLFNRHIEAIPHDAFLRYMGLYNVRWILVHSKESKRYLAGVPGVVPLASHEGLQTYRVEQEASFFAEGSGVVASKGPNRVVLDDLNGRSVVLKYHFIQGMRSEPPTAIGFVRLLDDPNPFIRITDPPRRLTLSLP